MELLQPKPFDTVSVSQQSMTYNKHKSQRKYNHVHSPNQQTYINCEICQEMYIKQQVNKKNRRYNSMQFPPEELDEAVPDNTNKVRFQKIQKQRGEYQQSENIKQIKNDRYSSIYDQQYNKNPSQLNSNNNSKVNSINNTRFDEIKAMKKEIDEINEHFKQQNALQYQEINNRKEVENNNKLQSRQSSINNSNNSQRLVELSLMQDSSVDLELRLFELFGQEYFNKIDYDSLVEDNIEYIAHILGECECGKGNGDQICVIRKDKNKKLKVKFRNGMNTSYSKYFQQFANQTQTKLPKIVQDCRLDNLEVENNFYISNQTNNQSEFKNKEKINDEHIKRVNASDTLQEYGPLQNFSNYKQTYMNFISDNSIADPINPVENKMMIMRLRGRSTYNKSFVQFQDDDYKTRLMKEEHKSAPFARYAPFFPETANKNMNRFINTINPIVNKPNYHNMPILNLQEPQQNLGKQLVYDGTYKTTFQKTFNPKVVDQQFNKPDVNQLKVMLLDKLRNKRINNQQLLQQQQQQTSIINNHSSLV